MNESCGNYSQKRHNSVPSRERSVTVKALAALRHEVSSGAFLLSFVLTLLTTLTEGFGVFLLIPIVGQMVGGTMSPMAVRIFATLGLPLHFATLLGLFIGLVALRAAIEYARALCGIHVSIAFVDGLRSRCFDAILRADWRKISQERLTGFQSLLITNVDRAGLALDSLLSGFATSLSLVGAGVTALLIAPRVALLVGAGGVLVVTGYAGARRRAASLGEELNAAYESIHTSTSESLGALRLIKSLSAEPRALHSFRQSFVELRGIEVAFTQSFGRATAVLQVLGATVLGLSAWAAIEVWHVPAAVLLPLLALSARTVPLLAALQRDWQHWLHGAPAIADIAERLERLQHYAEPSMAITVVSPRLVREIVARDITVVHPDRPVPALDSVTLSLRACSTTVVFGPSGAGKSTLADVLGGLIAPDAGVLLVDGVPLDPETRLAWRRSVAYVHQEPVLFHASIRDNLRWAAPDADDATLFAALSRAAADFVADLPGGLDTMVGDAGRQMSGGERQRIALARALLRSPDLLILDEPTSALDPASEASVIDALQRLRGTVTILIIAHRKEFVRMADHTIAIEDGRLVRGCAA